LPAHLALVAGWAASCTNLNDPRSCKSDLGNADDWPDTTNDDNSGTSVHLWTDLTYLLHSAGVSWAYYVDQGFQRDCDDSSITYSPKPQTISVPEIWNPLPDFKTMNDDKQLGNIQNVSQFCAAAKNGTLPNVVWIVPNQHDNEHPPGPASAGR
jgi:phospholipase C